MNPCPCCSGSLLSQVQKNSIYWFCPRCREQMPDLVAIATVCPQLANNFKQSSNQR